MTTATIESIETGHDQSITLRDVGWKGYSSLLRLRGERAAPKIVYLDGTVWLMSPSFPHERLKNRLGQFVKEVVVGLSIPCIVAGSTTLRRRAKRGGVEGDQTYNLTNAERIRGKDKIRLKIDPPPDLAIEAVYLHEADAAVEVYRRFKVPEVRVRDQSRLVILVLQSNGRYAESASGAAFPFLSSSEVFDWVSRGQAEFDNDWIKELRDWVRRTLRPRVRGQNKKKR
jgi:Uma2 family endonuclease